MRGYCRRVATRCRVAINVHVARRWASRNERCADPTPTSRISPECGRLVSKPAGQRPHRPVNPADSGPCSCSAVVRTLIANLTAEPETEYKRSGGNTHDASRAAHDFHDQSRIMISWAAEEQNHGPPGITDNGHELPALWKSSTIKTRMDWPHRQMQVVQGPFCHSRATITGRKQSSHRRER